MTPCPTWFYYVDDTDPPDEPGKNDGTEPSSARRVTSAQAARPDFQLWLRESLGAAPGDRLVRVHPFGVHALACRWLIIFILFILFILSACLFLFGCASAPRPSNYESVPAAGITASVVPRTNFTLYASANAATPRSTWLALTNGSGSVFVPFARLPTNAILYTQRLAWNKVPEPDIAGYTLYFGRVSGLYTGQCEGRGNANTVVLPGPGTWYFAVTAFDGWGIESAVSAEISAPAIPVIPPRSVFFCARAPVQTRLIISPVSVP